jgi:hypothetical protein
MKKLLLSLAAIALLAGCGGGGNGSGGGGLSHNSLAEQFVAALNASGAYSVTLVKSDTLVYDYIVIYDADYDEYDAIYIGNYTAGQDILAYMANATIYYDLTYNPGYYDWELYEYYDSFCACYVWDYRSVWIEETYTGYGRTFEHGAEAPKDVALYAELAEEQVVASRATEVSEKFGLSVDRSKEVVRLTMAWQKAGGKDLTERDQDAFSQEMLGFSITEAKAAVKAKNEGNPEAVEDLVERAAATNETTPEHVKSLIDTYIGQ